MTNDVVYSSTEPLHFWYFQGHNSLSGDMAGSSSRVTPTLPIKQLTKALSYYLEKGCLETELCHIMSSRYLFIKQ